MQHQQSNPPDATGALAELRNAWHQAPAGSAERAEIEHLGRAAKMVAAVLAAPLAAAPDAVDQPQLGDVA